jgi:hypothetical protein
VSSALQEDDRRAGACFNEAQLDATDIHIVGSNTGAQCSTAGALGIGLKASTTKETSHKARPTVNAAPKAQSHQAITAFTVSLTGVECYQVQKMFKNIFCRCTLSGLSKGICQCPTQRITNSKRASGF